MSQLQLGELSVVVPAGDRCGEGALWHAGERAIYWTDINRYLVHRHRMDDGATHSWQFDEPVVALSLTTDPAHMIVALGSGLLFWSPADDTRSRLGFDLPTWPAERLNDGRTDPAGNFWVGSMQNNVGSQGEPLPAGGTAGKLFRVGTGIKTATFRDGICVSNTLVWSPDRSKFYFADTVANIIWEHDYDPQDGIGAPREFFSGFERGFPDGSTIDSQGYIWNCRFGGGCILRIAPDGQLDRVIDMPVTNPTTATFGGPDLTTLYVTSASVFTPPTERLAGCLFALPTNVTGLPENLYRL